MFSRYKNTIGDSSYEIMRQLVIMKVRMKERINRSPDTVLVKGTLRGKGERGFVFKDEDTWVKLW